MRIKTKKSDEAITIDLKEIDNEINNITRKIFKNYPYIALPYMYLGRAYRNKGTAAVSANGWLIINPYWWNKITPEEKFFVIIHEILHAMLQHQIRMPSKYAKEYNIIADAIVNTFALNTFAELVQASQNIKISPEAVKEKIERLSMRNLVTWDTVRELFKQHGIEPPENLEKMSADDIFVRLHHAIIKEQKQRQALHNGPSPIASSNNGNTAPLGGKNGRNNSGRGGWSIPGANSEAGSSESGSNPGCENGGHQDSSQNTSARRKRYGGRASVTMDRGKNNADRQNQPQRDASKTADENPDTSTENYENGPLGGDLISNYDPSKDNAEVTKNPHPIFNKIMDRESAENAWRRIHREAANFQKLVNTRKHAGTGTNSIEELISIIDGESKISWQRIIKEAVREHYRGFTDRTFKREDRRYSSMQSLRDRKNNIYIPGVVRYNIPDIHVTFDTSGSMSEEELKQIITEVYTIAKKFRTKIRVTQWDWDIQDDRIVTSPSELKVFTVRGRGGTSIIPVLRYVLGEQEFNGKKYDLQKNSMFIVFSDFELFDDPDEVLDYLMKIEKKKKVRFIFVNTKTFQVFDAKRLGLKKAFNLALRSE